MVTLTARGKCHAACMSLQRTANLLMVLISHHVPHTEKTQNEKRLHFQQKHPKAYWDRPKLPFIFYLTMLLVSQNTHHRIVGGDFFINNNPLPCMNSKTGSTTSNTTQFISVLFLATCFGFSEKPSSGN
jgi:hypothetical protein